MNKTMAQIATAEKYGIRVEVSLDEIWKSYNSYSGNEYCKVGLNFIVSGENQNFSKVIVKIVLLEDKYQFAIVTTTGDLNKPHQELVNKFNSSAVATDYRMVEIPNQRLGNYVFSKKYWGAEICTRLMNEEQLKECIKIEIREVY